MDHARLTIILRMFLNTSVNFHLWYPGKFKIRSNIPSADTRRVLIFNLSKLKNGVSVYCMSLRTANRITTQAQDVFVEVQNVDTTYCN